MRERLQQRSMTVPLTPPSGRARSDLWAANREEGDGVAGETGTASAQLRPRLQVLAEPRRLRAGLLAGALHGGRRLLPQRLLLLHVLAAEAVHQDIELLVLRCHCRCSQCRTRCEMRWCTAAYAHGGAAGDTGYSVNGVAGAARITERWWWKARAMDVALELRPPLLNVDWGAERKAVGEAARRSWETTRPNSTSCSCLTKSKPWRSPVLSALLCPARSGLHILAVSVEAWRLMRCDLVRAKHNLSQYKASPGC